MDTRDFLLESEYCGRVYVYVQSVKILDYWGLFAVNVPMKAAARITILPELFSCDVAASPVCAVSDENAVSRKGEDRTEVFQLREYRSGDDIRQIHWKLSSKLDKLIIREASQSVSRSLLVFWDKRDDATPENMDAMAEATLDESLIGDADFPESTVLQYYPGSVPQWYEVQHQLASAQGRNNISDYLDLEEAYEAYVTQMDLQLMAQPPRLVLSSKRFGKHNETSLGDFRERMGVKL